MLQSLSWLFWDPGHHIYTLTRGWHARQGYLHFIRDIEDSLPLIDAIHNWDGALEEIPRASFQYKDIYFIFFWGVGGVGGGWGCVG